MFSRLRAVYGENFKDFLKDEQYVSVHFETTYFLRAKKY